MKRAIWIILLHISLCLPLSLPGRAAAANTDKLQERVNAAAPGEIVTVEPGKYEGRIVLCTGVALVGPSEGEAIIDGDGTEAAIEGAPDAILSNLTISGGKVGISTRGAFIGIFDCTILSRDSVAVHVCGGSAVLVNNIIEGGSICCNSSNPLLICNTIVTTSTDGLWTWYGPGPTAIDNLVVGAEHGVQAGAGSAPVLDSNAFWACGEDFAGCAPDENALFGDPLFADAEGGDLRLASSSPLIAAGRAVPGLWNDERPDVGWNSGRSCAAEECRAFMERVSPDLVPDFPAVVYTLGEETGEFLVTTFHGVSTFTVRSSTPMTAITGIEAFDEERETPIDATLIDDEYPRVEVRGDGRGERRSVLKHTYHAADSYSEDDEGRRIFRRSTNFPRVVVEIPDGFRASRVQRSGITIGEGLGGAVEIASPGVKDVEVTLERTMAAPPRPPD